MDQSVWFFLRAGLFGLTGAASSVVLVHLDSAGRRLEVNLQWHSTTLNLDDLWLKILKWNIDWLSLEGVLGLDGSLDLFSWATRGVLVLAVIGPETSLAWVSVGRSGDDDRGSEENGEELHG